jgi:tetratricopeptide (TPR) repeat protein
MCKSSTMIAASLILMMGALPAVAGWEEGVAAFTSKNYQGAVDEFQELVKQTPDGWRGHYMLGLSLEQLNRKEEALHHLRKAYDLNPNELSVKVALGRAYFNVRRYGDVTQLLGSVDASSLPAKQRAAFYQIRGEAKQQSGGAQAAVGDFEQLAKLQPDSAKAQYRYGATALSLGQTDAGIAALRKASQLEPGNGDMKRAYAQALLKKGRETRDKAAKKQNYLLASKVAGELVAKDASYDNLMLKLSAEIGAGVYAQAVETGKAAAAKSGGDWLAYYYLGQAYTSNGQYQEAVAPLEKARGMTTKPDDLKKIWSQLGFNYEKQKNYAKSIDAYQNAGDQGAVARVQKNEETDRFNKSVEEQNAEIEKMKKEAEELEAELKALEQGGGG